MTATFGFVGRRRVVATLLLMMDILNAPVTARDNAMTAMFGFVGRRRIVVTLLLMMDILNGTRYYKRQCDDSDVRLCGST